jgi:acyl dehydratase
VGHSWVGDGAQRKRASGVNQGAGADLSYEFAFGTYQDALAMVGLTTEPRIAGTVVSEARIQLFAALVRDANASYWDAEFATRVWRGLLAPPALLMGWLIPPPGNLGAPPPAGSIAIRVPLPGTTFVNASNDVEFPVPIVAGDRLSVVEEVVSVSPEKQTRLGVGHFIETTDTYRRQDGTVVARSRNTLFRFNPMADS